MQHLLSAAGADAACAARGGRVTYLRSTSELEASIRLGSSRHEEGAADIMTLSPDLLRDGDCLRKVLEVVSRGAFASTQPYGPPIDPARPEAGPAELLRSVEAASAEQLPDQALAAGPRGGEGPASEPAPGPARAAASPSQLGAVSQPYPAPPSRPHQETTWMKGWGYATLGTLVANRLEFCLWHCFADSMRRYLAHGRGLPGTKAAAPGGDLPRTNATVRCLRSLFLCVPLRR